LENIQKLIELRQVQIKASSPWNDEISSTDRSWNNTFSQNDQQPYKYNQQSNTNRNQSYSSTRHSSNRTNESIQCYQCHQFGHMARYCPQGKYVEADVKQNTYSKNQ